MFLTTSDFKVVIHVEMPKAAPPKVHLSFSKTRYDIEMKQAKYCELPQKYQFVIIKHKINC